MRANRMAAVKANITLKIDRELLRKARVLAAQKDTSVSSLVSEQLARAIRDHDGYEQARKRAFARMERASPLGYKPPASRDEFYER